MLSGSIGCKATTFMGSLVGGESTGRVEEVRWRLFLSVVLPNTSSFWWIVGAPKFLVGICALVIGVMLKCFLCLSEFYKFTFFECSFNIFAYDFLSTGDGVVEPTQPMFPGLSEYYDVLDLKLLLYLADLFLMNSGSTNFVFLLFFSCQSTSKVLISLSASSLSIFAVELSVLILSLTISLTLFPISWGLSSSLGSLYSYS